MASLIHIAEVAAILAVAYMLGWAVGYVARRLASRPSATDAVSPERIAAVMAQASDALVKAPVIVPVASDPPPPPPAPSAPPSMPSVETAIAPSAALAEPEPQPQPPAVDPALPPVVIAAVVPPPPMFTKPAPTPVPTLAEPEPVVAYSAAPAMQPGVAWTGEIKGRPAPRFDTQLTANADPVATPEPVAAEAVPSERPSVIAEPIVDPTVEPATAEQRPIEPVVEDVPVAAEPLPVAREPEPVVASPPPVVEYDEDAAMRAIEGGWSRTRARAMPGAPELADVGAAVAAAQSAVEQVLAKAGIDPERTKHAGKPTGLSRPRPSGKDNLKQISGLSALDESTLNNLGIYHFDQIAGWDETEVLWMENHVFARGRIGREDWQAQARTLASAVAG